jgi:hypothetical protein
LSRDGRDDDRNDVSDRTPERRTADRTRTRSDDMAARGLSLPGGEEREPVEFRGRTYSLNGAETRILATVGAFRVIPSEDLRSMQDYQRGSRNEMPPPCRAGVAVPRNHHRPSRVAVAPRHIPGLAACVSTLRPFTASIQRPRSGEETDQLQTYFTVLDLVERDDLKRVPVEELRRFRDLSGASRPRNSNGSFNAGRSRERRHSSIVARGVFCWLSTSGAASSSLTSCRFATTASARALA